MLNKENLYKSEKTSDFYKLVYDIVNLIPPGKVTTYGAIAKALGTSKSSRLVGMALISAHLPTIDLPIHRVVNRTGLLTGKHHYETLSKMQELLENEGIKIENDHVKDFKAIFWDPMIEL